MRAPANRKPRCLRGRRSPLVTPGSTRRASHPSRAGGAPAAAWTKTLRDHRYLILLLLLVCGLIADSFAVSPDLAGQFADPRGRTCLFLYFSLATITSVGYGDIAPLRGPMTAIAMLETVFGQFYIAVVVAQLVGMRLAQGPGSRGGG